MCIQATPSQTLCAHKAYHIFYFILNLILTWIIFKRYSMVEWIIKIYRPGLDWVVGGLASWYKIPIFAIFPPLMLPLARYFTLLFLCSNKHVCVPMLTLFRCDRCDSFRLEIAIASPSFARLFLIDAKVSLTFTAVRDTCPKSDDNHNEPEKPLYMTRWHMNRKKRCQNPRSKTNYLEENNKKYQCHVTSFTHFQNA